MGKGRFEDQGVTIITSETEDGTADDNSQTDESTDTSDASDSSENTDEAASGSGAE